MPDSKTPKASRPHVPGYGIPESLDGILPWSWVESRMRSPKNYWVATVRPDGRPHSVPVWGVWVEGILYFGGGPDTVWSRNLAASPQVVVHLESGDEVVIFEGTVDRINDPDHPKVSQLDDAYEKKYNMRHGTPFWILQPRVVFAWSKYPDDTTRFKFDGV